MDKEFGPLASLCSVSRALPSGLQSRAGDLSPGDGDLMELWKNRAVAPVGKRWAFAMAASSLFCLFLVDTSLNVGLHYSSIPAVNSVFSIFSSPEPPPPPPPEVPRLAYLVSGSKGDVNRLWRALRALYHPRNQYVVHLDLEAPAAERAELARRVAEDPLFAAVRNVHVITKANMVTYKGPTMVANTLHACAVLLRKSGAWDWFINLSASDYPLVTQDDLLHAFSSLPRDLNFVEHTSRLGWKEDQRAKPMIIDPGLYASRKSDLIWASQRRELPTSFKLFTGSAWMALTREFVEYCVWGWENLPRILLLYYANFVSSPEGYFQTVICNSPNFSATAVSHDLHYISWDVPPKQHPHSLTLDDFPRMVASNAPFARKFDCGDRVLDLIDAALLRRRANGSFVPGGWCAAGKPPCSEVGDAARLAPGEGARRLEKLMSRVVWSEPLAGNGRCKWERNDGGGLRRGGRTLGLESPEMLGFDMYKTETDHLNGNRFGQRPTGP